MAVKHFLGEVVISLYFACCVDVLRLAFTTVRVPSERLAPPGLPIESVDGASGFLGQAGPTESEVGFLKGIYELSTNR
jgi:hypothetical protein